jgi:hypothetical protein
MGRPPERRPLGGSPERPRRSCHAAGVLLGAASAGQPASRDDRRLQDGPEASGRPRPGSGFLDFRVDLPGTHDAQDFVDPIHYRGNLERQMEDAIIAQLHPVAIGSGPDQADDIAPATFVDSQLNGRSP